MQFMIFLFLHWQIYAIKLKNKSLNYRAPGHSYKLEKHVNSFMFKPIGRDSEILGVFQKSTLLFKQEQEQEKGNPLRMNREDEPKPCKSDCNVLL